MNHKGLHVSVLVVFVGIINGELCREKVCEYEFMIHTARTMVYYNKTSGKSYEAKLDGSDLVLAETLLIKKESHPDLVGRKVPSDDVITGNGVRRDVIAINGEFPGPTIEVMEGVEIVVRVANHMITDGVTLHWHGIHQYKTPFMDGAASITQCPIPPGQTFTYRFKADPAGTHWYHPHLHYQRADGGYGMIIIHKSEPMFPQHTVMVSDWFHQPMTSLGNSNPYGLGGALKGTGGVDAFLDYTSERSFSLDMVELSAAKYESALLNGRGRSLGLETLPLEGFPVNSGQKYIFRVASFSAEFFYRISIDEHKMTLIALDGQDIEPIFNLTSAIIAPGERFDVEITADQAPDQYWLRADSLAQYKGHYGTKIGETPGTKAVLVYDGHSGKDMDPEDRRESCTTSNPCRIYGCPWEYYPDGENRICIGLEDVKGKEKMPEEMKDVDQELVLNFEYVIGSSINGRKYRYSQGQLLGKKTEDIEGRCLDSACTSGCTCTNIYDLPLNNTVQLVLTNRNENSMGNTPHSVHIHGHQVYILKVGYSPQNLSSGFRTGFNTDLRCVDDMCMKQEWVNEPADLNLVTPPLRDTFVIPAGGYVVARLKTYNPGYWLFHCHQITHHAEGMAMVINVGDGHHPPLPEGFPACISYEFSSEQYSDYINDNWQNDHRTPDDNRTKKKETKSEKESCESDHLEDGRLVVSKEQAIGVCIGVGVAGIILGLIAAAICLQRAKKSKPYNISHTT